MGQETPNGTSMPGNLLPALDGLRPVSGIKIHDQTHPPQHRPQAHSPLLTPPQQYLSPYASSTTTPPNKLISRHLQLMQSEGVTNPLFTSRFAELVNEAIESFAKDVRRGSAEWEAAREAVAADLQTPAKPDAFVVTDLPATGSHNEARTGGRRGRGPRRRGSPIATGTIEINANETSGLEAPNSGRIKGRGRGSRGARPRVSRGGRGGRGPMKTGKRKRGEDEDDEGDESDDTDASETFAPLPTQSRSGRKIFQANVNNPIIKIDDKIAILQPSPSRKMPQNPNKPDQGKKKKYRRLPGAAAVCKNCGRGHSPSSNVIVFCDGCNTPWHQHCHDPPIQGEIVQIEEKEWFCNDCAVLEEEKERLNGRVAGEGLSLAERRQYLQTLTHDHLVSLLLHACSLHPLLPIFAPKEATSIPQILPSSDTEVIVVVDDSTNVVAEVAENYYEEEEALPYPKAGNGIIIPPESEDLAFLLDDDTTTFSHSWIGKPGTEPGPGSFLAVPGTTVSVGA